MDSKDVIATPYISSCSSLEGSLEEGREGGETSYSEVDSKYSSVGNTNSWLKGGNHNSDGRDQRSHERRDDRRDVRISDMKGRGRREGGKEYRDASRWEESGRQNYLSSTDLFSAAGAKVTPENAPSRPPRNGRK